MSRKKDINKCMDFKRREGEIYVKVTDGNFNKVYENQVGVNDKKAIQRLLYDLKNKGIELYYLEKQQQEDIWW